MDDIRRVKRTKQQARISYNRMSKWYDLFMGRLEKGFRDAGLKKLTVCEGEKVLEVGFGTGYCTTALAQLVGASGTVYAIDISEGMLNETASHLQKAGLLKRVELRTGDAADLPYPDNSFDAVFISFTLELFDTPEIPLVLKQCRRVLKENGRICIVAMSKDGKNGLMVKLYEWGHKRFPNYIDCRPIFLKEAMENAKLKVLDQIKMSLWNVPVEIVLARK